MKRHSDILTEYRGYRRACWITLFTLTPLCCFAMALTPDAWPPYAIMLISYGGFAAIVLWKTRGMKSHALQVE